MPNNQKLRLFMKRIVRELYIKLLRSRLSNELTKQRIKLLLWDVYGYCNIFGFRKLSFRRKLWLIRKCILVDWNIPHVHKACEIVPALKVISENPKAGDEVLVEAGVWLGGVTAKMSLLAELFGYRLYVFDSFEGAPPESLKSPEANYYVGSLEQVKRNVTTYGNIAPCIFIKGWFTDVFEDFDEKVKVAFLDCEKLEPTKEALEGIVPNVVSGGFVYIHDYQHRDIREMINSQEFWDSLGVSFPEIRKLKRNPVELKIKN